MVQHPGKLTRWAPVLVGPQGNGKSFLGGCIARAIGLRYRHMVRPKELGATHTGWMRGVLFAQVEEINMSDRRDILEELKQYITDDEINVRAMYTDSATFENTLNWFFCTNHEGGVIKTADDRRYTSRGIPAGGHFRQLFAWVKSGGYEHIAEWLGRYDIADFPNRAPRTTSTEAAIIASRGPIAQVIAEAIEAGDTGFRGGWVSGWHALRLFPDVKRPSPRAVQAALAELGYEKAFRASRHLPHEGGSQPTIYRVAGEQGRLDDYTFAQGYTEAPKLGNNVLTMLIAK